MTHLMEEIREGVLVEEVNIANFEFLATHLLQIGDAPYQIVENNEIKLFNPLCPRAPGF